MSDEKKTGQKLEGEGSYTASKKFQKDQREFAKSGKVDEKAREAADAIDGAEGDDLEKARKEASDGPNV